MVHNDKTCRKILIKTPTFIKVQAAERLPVVSEENSKKFVYELLEIAYFLDKNGLGNKL